MRQKNKPRSFTPPLQIPLLKKKQETFLLLRASLSLPLLKKTMNRKPNSSNLWRFLLRLDCTGKQVSELLKPITLNFMPTYH